METARPRVTASTATPTGSSAHWLPALGRVRLDEPLTAGAHEWQTTDGRRLYGRRDDATYWLWSPGVATFSFGATGAVTYDAHDEAAAIPLWRRSALPLALEARGYAVLHASAVHHGSGCVVVCGRSTSGKSTLAAAAAHDELAVVADDAIAFSLWEGPSVLTLPFELRPRPADDRLSLAEASSEGGDELSLRHLVLLEPDPNAQSIALEELSAGEAFGALMPHAYCFSLDDSRQRLIDEYSALAAATETARLRYRPEPSSLPAMVAVLKGLLGC